MNNYIAGYSYSMDAARKAEFERRMAAADAARGGLPPPPYRITYEQYMATQELYPRVLVTYMDDSVGNTIQTFRDVSFSDDGPIICQRNQGRKPGQHFIRMK